MGRSSPPRTKDEISAIMRKVQGQDTAPELAFRSALTDKGIEYETAQTSLPGKPDFVIPKAGLVIFIDGDYWHGNQWRIRRLTALEEQFQRSQSSSRGYWLEKIRRNMRRDCKSTAVLMREGWTVLRFWESDVRKDLEGCIEMTLELIRNGAKSSRFSVLPELTFAEFFAGIGLMRMGLENQGWSIAFANDIDPQKEEMYSAQFGEEKRFVLGDIHQLSSALVPTVTLATASFPCNDLSLAGARHGLKGEQSSAFWGFIRILTELGERRPPLILIENVTGFLTSHGGDDFRQALEALSNLGYSVDAFVLDAAHFVPQSRQRLFVVGILEDINRPAQISETGGFYQSNVRPAALAKFILTHPEINWKIRNLPSQPSLLTNLDTIVEDLSDDAPEWWSDERAKYLLNQMSVRHREIADRMIAANNWSYGTVFRRIRYGKSMAELRTDGIAGCLRTPRGGSGRQILFKAGKGQYFVRLLTPRECARLMGADHYNITVPLNQALFGFGDAVCVPVIEWIAKYYLNPVVNELIRGRALRLNRESERVYA